MTYNPPCLICSAHIMYHVCVSVLTLMMTSAKVVKINSGLAWSLLLLTTILSSQWSKCCELMQCMNIA